MPKGRNKPTPMVVYMNEMRDHIQAQTGRKFKKPFDEDLYVICKPLYDKLTETEKQYYKDRAKEEWTGIRDDKNKKLNSEGIPVAVIEKREAEKRQKKELEFLHIEELCSIDNEFLINQEFVIIHVNWFCKVSDQQFVPAEVAMVKFTLKDGMKDFFHCFPKVDEFPLGFKAEAKDHAEKTHKIPLDGNLRTESTVQCHEIFNKIMHFLAQDGSKKKLSTPNTTYRLYTLNDHVLDVTSRNAVKSFLNWIVEASCFVEATESAEIHEKYFQTYDLSKLFSELKKKDPEIPQTQLNFYYNEAILEDYLRRDSYLHAPNMACKYHDDIDQIPMCSLSRVKSWMYIICHESRFFGIPLIPGKHMPKDIVFESTPQNDSNDNDDDEEWSGATGTGYRGDDDSSYYDGASSTVDGASSITNDFESVTLSERDY